MTHYTMTIPVQAWRVEADGSLPQEAEWAIDDADSGFRQAGVSWSWWVESKREVANPGDWIVQTPYSLEAMTDEQFHECCTEVDPLPTFEEWLDATTMCGNCGGDGQISSPGDCDVCDGEGEGPRRIVQIHHDRAVYEEWLAEHREGVNDAA